VNARRAARELALLAFSQLSKNIEDWQDKDIEELVLDSVRTLTNDAESNIKKSIGELIKTREFIENYEIDHSENINRPIESSIVPVSVPLTSDMIDRIDMLINAAEEILSAIELAEISSLTKTPEVKYYINRLFKSFVKNRQEIDNQISKFSIGWNIDRLIRIDKDILRIAIVEILYFRDVPISVSIDEAVELAKKYSTDESSCFINGILRQVSENNKMSRIDK